LQWTELRESFLQWRCGTLVFVRVANLPAFENRSRHVNPLVLSAAHENPTILVIDQLAKTLGVKPGRLLDTR
jgi:hypothetical protein